MDEIIDFQSAKEQYASKKRTASQPVTIKRQVNPLEVLGRCLYEMGLDDDNPELKVLGGKALSTSLGLHSAGTVIENMEIKHQLSVRQK